LRDGSLLFQSTRPEVRSLLHGLAGEPSRSFPALVGAPQTQRSEKILGVEQRFCPDYLIDLILRLEKAIRPDLAIANYVFLSRPLSLLDRNVLKLIDTHDVFSTKGRKVVQFGIDDNLEMSGEEEAALLGRADVVVAIQPDEEHELRALAPDRRVVTAGVDFEVVLNAKLPSREPVILCVASDNALNVKGLRDFLSLAWPLVRRGVADARLRLVGPICDAVEGGDGVEFLGRLDRLEDVYAGARVIINPAVAGTGLKIKTLEALAHLRPIVVWPSGVDGLAPTARELCHVATDWYDFARKVIKLLSDETAQQLFACREEIRRQLSPDVVYAALRSAISGPNRPPRSGARSLLGWQTLPARRPAEN